MRDEKGLREARALLEEAGHEVVVEEYVAGPSLSLEVLCWDGRAVPLQVTGLEFDEGYDCKRVVAPVGERAARRQPAGARVGSGAAAAGDDWERAVPPGMLAAFDAVTVRLAEGLGLRGLMDVEVMLHDGQPKVLEIDARLPSQTPTAVYWSSGLNIVEPLRTFREARLPAIDRTPRGACVFQHVRAQDGPGCAWRARDGRRSAARARPGVLRRPRGAHRLPAGKRLVERHLITLGATLGEARRAADEVVAAVVAEEKLYLQPEGESYDRGGEPAGRITA